MISKTIHSFERYASAIVSTYDISCEEIIHHLNAELNEENYTPAEYAEYGEFYDRKKNDELVKFSNLYILSTYETILDFIEEFRKTEESLCDEYHTEFARLLGDIHHFKESSSFHEVVMKLETTSLSLIKELQERIS